MFSWADIGLVCTVVGGAITILNLTVVKWVKTMTEITSDLKSIQESFRSMGADNTESHRRLWEHNTTQDRKIESHEIQIKMIQTKIDIENRKEKE